MSSPLTAPQAFSLVRRKFGSDVCVVEKTRFRSIGWTYNQIFALADKIGEFLFKQKINKGDSIALCAPNSPYWLAVYIAATSRGVVVVPLDINSSESFIHKVLQEANCRHLFLSTYKALDDIPCQHTIIEDIEKIEQEVATASQTTEISPDDTLEIVYTSGSTSKPKGVVLTHKNVFANIKSLQKAWPIGREHTMLSLVPLSHMLEQTIGFLTPFLAGSKIVYIKSPQPLKIMSALRSEHITTIVAVPAFLQLLRNRILRKAADKEKLQQLNQALRIFRKTPLFIKKLVFRKIYNSIGNSLRYMIIGGAKLPESVEDFWENVGINVIQGYGLTEASPLVTYNHPNHKKRGSVGRVLPDVEFKLNNENEILIKGPNIFSKYFNNPQATSEAFEGGWYHTGDIAEIDNDGFVFLKGRSKNMLLSSSGLNIYPEDIEQSILNDSAFADCVVMMLEDPQTKTNQLAAVLITDLDQETAEDKINDINSSLASHQQVRKVVIWEEADFPRTRTQKVKRNKVISRVNKLQKDKESSTNKVSTDPLTKILSRFSEGEVKEEAILTSDLNIDSIKRLELVSAIEEKFNKHVPETAINNHTSVSDLRRMIEAANGSLPHSKQKLPTFEQPLGRTLRALLQLPLLAAVRYYQALKIKSSPASTQPAIYIANHTSHFDALTFLRFARQQQTPIAVAAAKDYFFDNPLKSFFARLVLRAFPLERNESNITSTLHLIGKYLDNDISVLIFPEGTRSTTGEIGDFQSGIGVIARQLKAPVVPVKLTGNYEILPKGSHWPTPGKTTMKLGRPQTFSATESYQSITDSLQQKLRQL